MDLIGRSRYALAANALTVSRFVLSPVMAWLIVRSNPTWLNFGFGWLLGATDFVDGKLARHAKPTKFGAFVDPLADKLVILLGGWALVHIGRFPAWPIVVIAIREIGIQAYRTYWGKRGLSIPARTSAKYKVFAQAVALSAALLPPLEPYPWVADWLLYLAVAFTVITGIQYVLDGRDAMTDEG